MTESLHRLPGTDVFVSSQSAQTFPRSPEPVSSQHIPAALAVYPESSMTFYNCSVPHFFVFKIGLMLALKKIHTHILSQIKG